MNESEFEAVLGELRAMGERTQGELRAVEERINKRIDEQIAAAKSDIQSTVEAAAQLNVAVTRAKTQHMIAAIGGVATILGIIAGTVTAIWRTPPEHQREVRIVSPSMQEWEEFQKEKLDRSRNQWRTTKPELPPIDEIHEK